MGPDEEDPGYNGSVGILGPEVSQCPRLTSGASRLTSRVTPRCGDYVRRAKSLRFQQDPCTSSPARLSPRRR